MATKSSKSTDAVKKSAPKSLAKSVKSKGEAKPKKVAIKTTPKVPTEPVATRKKRAIKATSTKAAAKIFLDPKPVSAEPVIPHEEISLRAYYIAERRHKMGWPGNSGTDWADALSQLRAEALEKPVKKR